MTHIYRRQLQNHTPGRGTCVRFAGVNTGSLVLFTSTSNTTNVRGPATRTGRSLQGAQQETAQSLMVKKARAAQHHAAPTVRPPPRAMDPEKELQTRWEVENARREFSEGSLVPTVCDDFLGCASSSSRQSTLSTARSCLQAHLLKNAHSNLHSRCGGAQLWSPPAASRDKPAEKEHAEPYCGYRSAAAIRWLSRVHNASKDCERVVFTVITDAYDVPKRVPGCSQLAASSPVCRCLFALVDQPTHNSFWSENSTMGWSPWTPLLVPPIFAGQPSGTARAAHMLKLSAHRLFPLANSTMYIDGKMSFNHPPATVFDRIAEITPLPLVMVENNVRRGSLDFQSEYIETIGALRRKERGAVLEKDLADLDRQRQFYCQHDQACNNQAGRIDASFIVQQRWARPRSVLDPPAAMLLRWFECTWFEEVQLFSHREQTAYSYVIDQLGVRNLVHNIYRDQIHEMIKINRHRVAAGMG